MARRRRNPRLPLGQRYPSGKLNPISILVCQRVSTTADRNGNSRRVWIIYYCDEAGFATVYKAIHEYGGEPAECRTLGRLLDVQVSPSDFRELVKEARE